MSLCGRCFPTNTHTHIRPSDGGARGGTMQMIFSWVKSARKIEMEYNKKKNFLNKHILFKYPMPLDNYCCRLSLPFAIILRYGNSNALTSSYYTHVHKWLCVIQFVGYRAETTYYFIIILLHNFRFLIWVEMKETRLEWSGEPEREEIWRLAKPLLFWRTRNSRKK